MPTQHSKPSRTRFIIGSLFILTGIILLFVFTPSSTELTPVERVELESLKNSGIAMLENTPNVLNHQGAAAIEAFTSITQLAPGEMLGHRNLVIASLLVLEKHRDNQEKEPALFTATLQATKKSLAILHQQDPASGIPEILDAKLAEILNDPEAAVKHYQAAMTLRPNDQMLGSEIFMLLRNNPDVAVRDQAILDATKNRLDNLVLLEALVRYQAENKDPKLLQSVTALIDVLAPFAATLASQTIDIKTELPAFKLRLQQQDATVWPELKTRLIQVFNVMRQEFGYQTDLFQLQRHILEYVIHDFSNDFHTTNHPPIDPATAINVSLTAAPSNNHPASEHNVLDVAICDFNLDRKLEIIVLTPDSLTVFVAVPKLGSQWSTLCQTSVPAGMQHIVVADFDRDATAMSPENHAIADVDFMLYGTAGFCFIENKLDPDTQSRSLALAMDPAELSADTSIVTATLVDIENDGDLDVVTITQHGLQIIKNLENWDFIDATASSATQADHAQNQRTVAAVDYNLNIQADILLPNGYFENIRHGRYRWRENETAATTSNLPVAAIAIADADANGSWDTISASDAGISIAFTRTQPGQKTTVINTSKMCDLATAGVTTWDFDNDGILDIVAWGPSGLWAHRGLGGGEFDEPLEPRGLPTGKVTRCQVGDLDDDGDLDLVIVVNSIPLIIDNEGGNQNNWIRLHLAAEPDPKFAVQRCNTYGLGSRAELLVGNQYQLQQVSDQVTHFGIGKQTAADALRVLWTNGIPQSSVEPDTRVTIVENQELLTGSCPYLYTWTGQKYEFFTDLLWAAPIGLQFAEGILAPTRDTEHLLIPGDRLQPINGEYRLQVTEELWEAAYFDDIQLIAVDHPTATEVYSNEKVGPPSISKYKIHSFASAGLRSPVSAHGSDGQDVLAVIKQRDGKFTKLFDRRQKQGLVPEYFLELDLGDLSLANQNVAKTVQLVMTGWMFPTDTSINIAISQNRKLSGSQPPSIWMPRVNTAAPAQTNWVKVVPNMGFPGGKTKTIVVDVPGEQFRNGDHRIRIVTTMELYWDSIQVFVGPQQPAPSVMTKTNVELTSADLHYRGYSARLSRLHNGPERYAYNYVWKQPRWSPMAGNYTRYGEVTELLQATDDHLVVLGSGDEMTLRFAELPPPKAGFVRDFIIRCVGWDKDASLNTVAGHRVEPLPFTAMKSYPFGPAEQIPDSPSYREYLRVYQTRQLEPQPFWDQLRQ
ncbi:MAG TPA: CRTAC1 family protein [Planctomycetes bacterium]|nr:CRTAC1 family protein [Planctomycetota bacterium]